MDTVKAPSKMLAGPENYKSQKSTIQIVLEREDLWEVVAPNDTTSQAHNAGTTSSDNEASSNTATAKHELEGTNAFDGVNNINSNITKQTPQKRENVKRRRTRAMDFIQLSITEMVQPYIPIITDPEIAWKTVANFYSTQTIADIMKTLDRQKNLQMMDGMSVSVFMQYVY